MKTLFGSTISSPFRASQRGTFATTSDPDVISEQAVITVLETRQGERVMMPDFGIPDVAFSVLGTALAERLRFHIEEQVRLYVPGVEILNVSTGRVEGGKFTETERGDEHQLHVRIGWHRSGARSPRILVHPTWRLRNGA